MWSQALFVAMWPLFYGLVLAFPLDRPDRHGTRLLRAWVVVTVVFLAFDLAVDQRVDIVDDPVRLIGFGNWTGLVAGSYGTSCRSWWCRRRCCSCCDAGCSGGRARPR